MTWFTAKQFFNEVNCDLRNILLATSHGHGVIARFDASKCLADIFTTERSIGVFVVKELPDDDAQGPVVSCEGDSLLVDGFRGDVVTCSGGA